MGNQRWLDFGIMLAYLAAMVSVGVRFARKQTSTETYFVANRSIPSWAMGMSLVATLITSVTFVAYPGSSYGKNWSLLIPGFMVVGVLLVVGKVIIPFYRHVVGMSAYEYFGKRFGRPTRLYASFAFSLAHFSKMGFIFYLLALTVNSMTGWSIDYIIPVVGAVTIFYTVIGGLEAVIWTDVIQGFVLWIGVAVCLGYLLFLPPGGPAAVLRVAWENHKFSFGQPEPRSLAAHRDRAGDLRILLVPAEVHGRSDGGAAVPGGEVGPRGHRGVALGAALCVPVWTLFMLIGTCTWSFFKLTGEKLPAYITKADQVFPYFLTMHLPVGMAGLFMASLMGAAMSGLASDLNCLAVVGVEDFYRGFRPGVNGHPAAARGQSDRGLLRAAVHRHRAGAGALQGRRALHVVFDLGDRVGRSGRTVPAGVLQHARHKAGSLRRDCRQRALHDVGYDDAEGRQPAARSGRVQLSVARSDDRRGGAHGAAVGGICGEPLHRQARNTQHYRSSVVAATWTTQKRLPSGSSKTIKSSPGL